MMGVRIGSIKTRFALFILLFNMAIIWCGAAFFSHLLQEEMLQQLGKQQFSSVSTLAEAINGELTGHLGALEQVANDIHPEMMASPATLQVYLAGQPVFQNFFSGGTRILLPDGSVLVSIPNSPEQMAANYADRDYAIGALKNGRPTIGRPVIGKVLKVPALSLAVPIRGAQGLVVGALVGTIDVNRSSIFDRIISSQYGGSGGYALFAPQHGLVLAATNKSFVIEPARDPSHNVMLDRYMQGYEGYGVHINSRGIEDLSAARGIPAAGWFLVGRIPTAEAFAPIRAMQTRIIYAALLISVFAGLVAWWWFAMLLRREFRPMLAATDAVEAMAKAGQRIQPLPVREDDEIGKLIAGFNRLLEILIRRDTELRDAEWKFQALFNKGPYGVAYHEMVYDESGNPTDFRFIDVNESYIELVGYDPRGKTARRAFPGIEKDPFDWIGTFGQVARTGKEVRFEHYLPWIDRWVLCIAYQYKPDQFVAAFLNITDRKKAEDALRSSEESLSTTLYSIGDAVIATDLNGQVTRMNPMAERMTGWTFSDAHNRPLFEVFHIINADTREMVDNPVQRVLADGLVVGLANHTTLVARDGQEFQIADSAAPICKAGGEISGVVLVFSDVTEKYRTQNELYETQAILQAAFDQSPTGIAIADAPNGDLRYVNNAGLEIFGQNQERVANGSNISSVYDRNLFLDRDGKPVSVETSPLARAIKFGETGSSEFKLSRADKSERTVVARGAPIRNKEGEIVAGISILIDISEHKLAEEKISHLAYYDHLTDLPNRRLLIDRLEHTLLARSRRWREGALLIVDLDNFKSINDARGHGVGDQLLIQVSQRLVSCVREGDTVARLGGDEFVIVLEELSDSTEEAAAQAKTIGMKILAALGEAYPLASFTHHCSACIGVTLFSDGPGTVEDLLKQADMAMYQAKKIGHNNVVFFDEKMQAAVTARAALEKDLREAILKEQFVIYYQAQIDSSNKTIGVEALIRWLHPTRGFVFPAEFIPLAEETGLILPIGRWVLDTACNQLADWAKRHEFSELTIAVNISAYEFHHKEFVDQVLATLQRNNANPHRLKLELTESLLVHDLDDVVSKMTTLKVKGISFSLDDFGTGYSSLSYLKRLPLDQLKIDQSFVRDVNDDPNDAVIAQTIITLGQSLGLAVIAEGVETEAQKNFLASHGCMTYQGFLFSKPLPLGDFERFVQKV